MADSAVVRSEWGSRLSEVVDGIGIGSAGTDWLRTISAEGSGAGSDNGAGDSTAGGMDSEQVGEAEVAEGSEADGMVEITEMEDVRVAGIAGVEAVGVIASAC